MVIRFNISLMLVFCAATTVSSQAADFTEKVCYSSETIERKFLEHNLLLIAEKMNVEVADAAITQAKLWNNPTLSFSDINLWKQEEKEFSAELTQAISISGKRSKQIRIEKLSKEIAIARFTDVMLGLRFELRRTVTDLYYQQQYMRVLLSQSASLESLISSYTKLLESGNISKGEIIRLSSALFEVDNEIAEVKTSINGYERKIKDLISEDSGSYIEILEIDATMTDPDDINIQDMLYPAVESRPDMIIKRLTVAQNRDIMKYERSLRMPDLNISAVYDRRGGVWNNFYGVGIGMDLPVFNRNQGAIKAASIVMEQSAKEMEQHRICVTNEIYESFVNYRDRYRLYEKSLKISFSEDLDAMLSGYTRRLASRDISMLEYIDFMESYKNTRNIILSAHRDALIQFEELKYTLAAEELK